MPREGPGMATSTMDPRAAGLTRPAAPTAARAAWTGFAVVLAAAVMDLLDSTIAQTAAPARRLHAGHGALAAARRPTRRPLRPPARPARGHGRVRGRLGAVRARAERR